MSNEGHDLSEFPNYYGDEEPQGGSSKPDTPPEVQKIDITSLTIDKKYRGLITEGWDRKNNGEYPSNSELVMAVASHLHRRGYPFDTFYSICLDVNHRMSQLLVAKHGGNLDSWLYRTWMKASSGDDTPMQGKEKPPEAKPRPLPKEAEKDPKITLVKQFSPRPFTERLMTDHELIYDKFKRFWMYDKEAGLWTEDAEAIIETELRTKVMGPEAHKRHYVAEIMADVKALCYRRDITMEPLQHLIPLDNGIYNLDTDELKAYSPAAYFTQKLATKYNNDAECPLIDRVFKEIVAPEKVDDLYELIAYSLYRDYPTHKLFFLFGRGSNGKTVYTTILERLLGKENISTVSLYELQNNRFAGAELFNRYINLSSELEYRELKKTNLVKKLSGGDPIRAERKYKESFLFHNHAKLIFITNELPMTADKTIAFYRRVHLIEFPNVFKDDDDDKLLLSKIDKHEIEGLMARAIAHLRHLRNRGWAFINDMSISEAEKNYEKLTNPLGTFLEEECIDDFDGYIAKSEFSNRFIEWLKDKGFRKWTADQIGKGMKARGNEDGKKTIETEEGEGQKRCWLGLKWK